MQTRHILHLVLSGMQMIHTEYINKTHLFLLPCQDHALKSTGVQAPPLFRSSGALKQYKPNVLASNRQMVKRLKNLRIRHKPFV